MNGNAFYLFIINSQVKLSKNLLIDPIKFEIRGDASC